MSVVFQTTVTAAAGDVAEALAGFSQVASGLDIPDRARRDLLVVLDELLANVVMHSLTARPNGSAVVTVERHAASIELTVRDDGPPFDPLGRETPDTSLDVAARPIGGLGLHLVQRLTDGARYERAGQHNILTVVKRLPATSDTSERESSPWT